MGDLIQLSEHNWKRPVKDENGKDKSELGDLVQFEAIKANKLFYIRNIIIKKIKSDDYGSIQEHLIRPLESYLEVKIEANSYFDVGHGSDFSEERIKCRDSVYAHFFKDEKLKNISEEIERLFIFETALFIYNGFERACTAIENQEKTFKEKVDPIKLFDFFKSGIKMYAYGIFLDFGVFLKNSQTLEKNRDSAFESYVSNRISLEFISDQDRKIVENWPNYKYFDEIFNKTTEERSN